MMITKKIKRNHLFTEEQITISIVLNFQIKLEILTKLLTNHKMNVMVKMTCQNCSIQKTEKKLNLINLINLIINLNFLKIALSVLKKMLIISFFMQLSMVLCTIDLMEKYHTRKCWKCFRSKIFYWIKENRKKLHAWSLKFWIF